MLFRLSVQLHNWETGNTSEFNKVEIDLNLKSLGRKFKIGGTTTVIRD